MSARDLWDATAEDALDDLQLYLLVGSARLGGTFCHSWAHYNPSLHTGLLLVLTTGVWSFAGGGCTSSPLGAVLALRRTPFKCFYVSG